MQHARAVAACLAYERQRGADLERDLRAGAPYVMDPLHGSQLRILDAGGALTVVLEHVDEDDALCTALVCTTFRDALFAQARHRVQPAGKLHAGKRIVTTVAGVASSVGRLAWVTSLGDEAPKWVCRWDART